MKTDPRPGRRVLVVDDHPVNRLAAVAQLAALGYAADAAESGETALASLAARPYDAVLLDCEMPELDGYETCRRLRQREGSGAGSTVVIALTAHTAAGIRERCLDAGMDDHLGKPWRGEDLAAVLSRWLEGEAEPSGLPAIESDAIDERLAALERLGEKTGEDMLRMVVESFLHRGARDLEAMRQALDGGDAPALAAAAHSLAGSSGILGAAGLSAGCAELEELARRQDLVSCASRLRAVEDAYPTIASYLQQMLRPNSTIRRTTEGNTLGHTPLRRENAGDTAKS